MATTKYTALFPSVAPRANLLLHVLVHGAANVPSVTDNVVPECFVAVCNSRDTGSRGSAGDLETVNSTNVLEGDCPYWNEMIYVRVSEDDAAREDILLLIVDNPSNRALAEHRIPWAWLVPYYQYHLNLQVPHQTRPTICLYVSMMVKESTLSKENIRYFGIEALVERFDVPLVKAQSIHVVARIVSNYSEYMKEFLKNPLAKKVGVKFQRIINPVQQDFRLPALTNSGYPQISLLSKPSTLPTWRHLFLFSHREEIDNMFIGRSGSLVIEFYLFQNIAGSTNWRVSAFLGWASIRLDIRTQDALKSSIAKQGMRTEGLVVENEGDLAAEGSKYESVQVSLHLIDERHPMKTLLHYAHDNLPVLPSYYGEPGAQGAPDPVYMQAIDSKRHLLPKIKSSRPPAIRTPVPLTMPVSVPAPQPAVYTTPMYQMPQYEVAPAHRDVEHSEGLRFRVPRVNPYDLDDIPTEYRAMLATNYPPRRDDDVDGWFDYFQREVSMYKQAIRRIIQDVAQLRSQHKTMTAANADLRTKIENFDKKKKVLYEIFEGDKMDKVKIQDIFNRLNARISSQALELKENHIKIANYEKELARRSELRAQYDALVRNSDAREIEMKMIRDRLKEAHGLEETVRRQELTIERMEVMINNYMKDKRSRGALNDMDRTFLSEHAALGLDTNPVQRPVASGRYTALVNTEREDLARQNLAYQQELAHLKARFDENTSAWGREKAELLTEIDDFQGSTGTPRARKSKTVSIDPFS